MAFMLGGSRNYASIVAPLKKMVADLASYMEEQKIKITGLETQKAQIESDIKVANGEISKSNFTSAKINDLLGTDLDENSTKDVDEISPDSTDSSDIEIQE